MVLDLGPMPAANPPIETGGQMETILAIFGGLLLLLSLSSGLIVKSRFVQAESASVTGDRHRGFLGGNGGGHPNWRAQPIPDRHLRRFRGICRGLRDVSDVGQEPRTRMPPQSIPPASQGGLPNRYVNHGAVPLVIWRQPLR